MVAGAPRSGRRHCLSWDMTWKTPSSLKWLICKHTRQQGELARLEKELAEKKEQLDQTYSGPVLDNQYGFDFGFALAPKLRLVNHPDQTSEAARRRVGFRRASQKWAIDVLLSGRREKIPSDHALDLMAAEEALT